MTDRKASWGTTLLFSACLAWGCYQLGRQLPAMGSLLAGLGMELPEPTAFVISLSAPQIWSVGALLIAVLIGKELLFRNATVRLTINAVVFVVACGFFAFAVSALREPLVEVMEKIEE
jgi:uncharacterized membrane protein